MVSRAAVQCSARGVLYHCVCHGVSIHVSTSSEDTRSAAAGQQALPNTHKPKRKQKQNQRRCCYGYIHTHVTRGDDEEEEEEEEVEEEELRALRNLEDRQTECNVRA